jgi:DNA-binding beta-propeller fold protein YncE
VYTLDSLAFKATLGIGKEDQFHYPTHLWVDAAGRIYVSDALNFLVRILDKDKRLIGSFGGPGLVPGTFSRPKGIATDSDGHIYVVDALFDNVQIFDDAGRPLLAFGSAGTNIGQFWLPNGIHIDGADRIYIADAYNQRIQIFQYVKVEATRP